MNTSVWLPLALAAYGIFSFNGIIDKIVVSKRVKDPLMVSFFVSLTGWVTVIVLLLGLIPGRLHEIFQLHVPPLPVLAFIWFGEIVLQLGLLLQYRALFKGEATRIISVIGAGLPIFSFVFAYALLHETLSAWGYVSFGVLVVGALLMLIRRGRWQAASFVAAMSAAACMAFETVVARAVYQHQPFISSMILFGVGDLIYNVALLMLVPRVRLGVANVIKDTRRQGSRGHWMGTFALIITNGVLAGFAIVFINLAFKYGPVSLVNALKGVQYTGVFLIALILSRFRPKLLKEELTGQTMRQKLAAILIIATGLIMLTTTGL